MKNFKLEIDGQVHTQQGHYLGRIDTRGKFVKAFKDVNDGLITCFKKELTKEIEGNKDIDYDKRYLLFTGLYNQDKVYKSKTEMIALNGWNSGEVDYNETI